VDLPNKVNIQDIPIFFILGQPRSGTTLLRNLFDAHPNVSIPGEFPFIPYTFRKYQRKRKWSNAIIHNFVIDISYIKKFQNLHISKHDIEKIIQIERDKKSDFTFSDAFKVIALNYPSAFKKSNLFIIGDKNPEYSYRPKMLSSLFPNAKYVIITRDYRDVVASIKKIDFALPFTSLICYHWKISQKRISRAIRKNPQLFLTMRYEEFVASPEENLNMICSFLGIEFDRNVFNTFNQADALAKEFDNRFLSVHHKSVMEPVSNKHVEKWRLQLSPLAIKIADITVGKWAEKSGYNRESKFRNPLIFLLTIPELFLGYAIFLIRFSMNVLPRKTRHKFLPVSTVLASFYYKIKHTSKEKDTR
jgi:hypothetical protein